MTDEYDDNTDEFFESDQDSWPPGPGEPGRPPSPAGAPFPDKPPGWGWFPDSRDPSTWQPPSFGIPGLPEPPELPFIPEPHFLMRITPAEARVKPGNSLEFVIHLLGKPSPGSYTTIGLQEVRAPWPSPGTVRIGQDEVPLRAGTTERVSLTIETRAGQPEGYYAVAVQATERSGSRQLSCTAWVGVTVSDKLIFNAVIMGTPHETDL
jgi:hypothetical protein